MVRQTGPCRFDDNGLLLSGTIIRHLILPGQLNQAKAVMDWVARAFAPGTVLFSLMSQYTPWGDLSAVPELNRRLRPGEIRAAQEYMQNLSAGGGVCQRPADTPQKAVFRTSSVPGLVCHRGRQVLV